MGGLGVVSTGVASGIWPPGSVLGSLSNAARERMLGIGAMQQFPPDKRLIDEGDEESKVVYLLLAGMVKVTGAMDFGDAPFLQRREDVEMDCS